MLSIIDVHVTSILTLLNETLDQVSCLFYLPSCRIHNNASWVDYTCSSIEKHSTVCRCWIIDFNIILTVISPIQLFIDPVPCNVIYKKCQLFSVHISFSPLTDTRHSSVHKNHPLCCVKVASYYSVIACI